MSNMFRLNIWLIWPGDKATMGEMYVNGSLPAMTLELPWKDDFPDQSSIPEGTYRTEVFSGMTIGETNSYSPTNGNWSEDRCPNTCW